MVTLTKTAQGFGFKIKGGNRPGELIQIDNIVKNSEAHHDGRLHSGDILVRINGISVLTYSLQKVMELYQRLRLGSNVEIEVRRGYPLPNMRRNDDFQSASGAAGGGGGEGRGGRGQGYQGVYGEPPPGEFGEGQGLESIVKHFVFILALHKV